GDPLAERPRRRLGDVLEDDRDLAREAELGLVLALLLAVHHAHAPRVRVLALEPEGQAALVDLDDEGGLVLFLLGFLLVVGLLGRVGVFVGAAVLLGVVLLGLVLLRVLLLGRGIVVVVVRRRLLLLLGRVGVVALLLRAGVVVVVGRLLLLLGRVGVVV